MKTKLYLLILFVFLGELFLAAQAGEGLYLTPADFASKKLSHQAKHSHVKTHEVFKKDIIQIVCNDSTFTYKKDSVYGYHSNEGIDYRIVGKKFYPIMNPTEPILIYKWLETPAAKGQPAVYRYYFSKDYQSPLFILNLNNLETVFENNSNYLKMLEVHFGDQSNLLEYDSIHHLYKINRLLKLAEQE